MFYIFIAYIAYFLNIILYLALIIISHFVFMSLLLLRCIESVFDFVGMPTKSVRVLQLNARM